MSQWVPAPTSQVRIGDAERDQAVSALGEHFVAGRLTQDEFDERSDAVTQARYADDLAPLFADLPGPSVQQPVAAQLRSQGRRPGPPPLVWLAPVLMIGLVATAVTLTVPWLPLVLFGVILFHAPWRRRGWHGGPHHYHRR